MTRIATHPGEILREESNRDDFPMIDIPANPTPAFAPKHPGTIIRNLLNEARMPARGAAASMGVTAPALGNILLTRSGISPDMALRLSRYFGNTPQFWSRLQEQYDLWHRERALRTDLDKIQRLAFEAA